MKVTVIVEHKSWGRTIKKTASVEIPDDEFFTINGNQSVEEMQLSKIAETTKTLLEKLAEK